MRKVREIALASMLTAVGAIGLAACGGTTTTSTQVVPTVAATSAPTAMMVATTEATAMMVATTEPTAMMQSTAEATAMMVATSAPTAMTTDATAMPVATTSGGGGMTISGPGADLLNKYFTAFKGVTSYHSVTESSITVGGNSVSTKSETDFQAPNLTRTTIEIANVGKTETITIGGDSYTKSPGIETYLHTTFPMPTDASNLSFLPFIETADVVGDETIDGVATTHLKYTYDADKFMAQSGAPTPAVSMGKTTIELWLDKSTNLPVRDKTVTPASTVTTTRSKFNEPVSPPIEKPTNVTEMPKP